MDTYSICFVSARATQILECTMVVGLSSWFVYGLWAIATLPVLPVV